MLFEGLLLIVPSVAVPELLCVVEVGKNNFFIVGTSEVDARGAYVTVVVTQVVESLDAVDELEHDVHDARLVHFYGLVTN